MEFDKVCYSVAETAKICNVSRYQIYEAVHQGKLKAVHFGKRIIVPANSIKILLGIAETEGIEKQED